MKLLRLCLDLCFLPLARLLHQPTQPVLLSLLCPFIRPSCRALRVCRDHVTGGSDAKDKSELIRRQSCPPLHLLGLYLFYFDTQDTASFL